MLDPRAFALSIGLIDAGLLAILARILAPLRGCMGPLARVTGLAGGLVTGLIRFATGYAAGWGTAWLLNRTRAALENEPGNTAPMV